MLKMRKNLSIGSSAGSLETINYVSPTISLDVQVKENITKIRLSFFTQSINTRDFPKTIEFWAKHFPSVLTTECFNDRKLPFIKEVESTELGHLFEHVLIDNLCLAKIAVGEESAVVNGQTKWNWDRDPYGVFHVLVYTHERDLLLLQDALKSTIEVTELFLSTLPQKQYSKLSGMFINEALAI